MTPTPEQFEQIINTPGALKGYSRCCESHTLDFIMAMHRDLRIMEAAHDLRPASTMLQRIAEVELECDNFVEQVGAENVPLANALNELLKALRKDFRRTLTEAKERNARIAAESAEDGK